MSHAHRKQTEIFEGVAGTVELQLGKRRITLAPGGTATIAPSTGVLHIARQRGDPVGACRHTNVLRGAAPIARSLRAAVPTSMLGIEGLLRKQPLVAALLLHKSDLYMPPLPRWIYWPLIGVLARFGRWTGGERVLAQYGKRRHQPQPWDDRHSIQRR